MYPVKLSLSRPRKILTEREEDVLIEIINGKNNNEIAEKLCISVHTVKFHVTSILHKFGVSRREELIIKAIIEGWVDIV